MFWWVFLSKITGKNKQTSQLSSIVIRISCPASIWSKKGVEQCYGLYVDVLIPSVMVFLDGDFGGKQLNEIIRMGPLYWD